MFFDLDVPYAADDTQLARTLAFLQELGYNAVALNHTVSGKLPTQITCAIPDPLPTTQVQNRASPMTILRRITLVLTDMHPNARLAELGSHYDLLAVKAVDERTLQLACSSIDCDIITMDLGMRLPFFFKHKMLNEAVRAGKRLEIGYGAGMVGADSRRHLIANATQLIRACRGRGVVVSSGAKSVLAARGPWDVINLTTTWGLGQERGYEALTKEPRNLVVNAKLKRTSYRGVVDVVYGGEKPVKTTASVGQKRKVHEASGQDQVETAPLSKTQMKKRARLEAAQKQQASNEHKQV